MYSGREIFTGGMPMINDDVHGRLTPDSVEDILAKYE